MAETITPIIELAGLSTECHFTGTEVAAKHVAQSKSELMEIAGVSFADSLVTNITETTSQWSIRAEGLADDILGTVPCIK